jgi:hypothetical protein
MLSCCSCRSCHHVALIIHMFHHALSLLALLNASMLSFSTSILLLLISLPSFHFFFDYCMIPSFAPKLCVGLFYLSCAFTLTLPSIMHSLYHTSSYVTLLIVALPYCTLWLKTYKDACTSKHISTMQRVGNKIGNLKTISSQLPRL